jgi:outer membrane protease
MRDRDWLEPSIVPGSLTLFSEHDNNHLVIFTDLESGMSLPVAHGFSLRLSLAASYMYFSFLAMNGYVQYGPNNHDPSFSNLYVPWDASWPKTAITGMGVDYTQYWIMVKPTLGCQWKSGRFEAFLSLALSPFVYCYAEDYHYLRAPSLFIRDSMSGGVGFEPIGSVFFLESETFSIGLTVFWRYISEMRGDLEQEERYSTGPVSAIFQDMAGTSLQCLSVGLTARYTF